MSNSITKENVLRTFPEPLQRSAAISALGEVMADYLGAVASEASLCALYTQIDELPDGVLDILAYDFKIDWWDAGLTVAQKRRIFKNSFFVHRHLGTAQSVSEALEAMYPGSSVQEWFDYDGDPYRFKLRVNVTDGTVSSAGHAKILKSVDMYKSARSVLEGVEYFIHKEDLARLTMYAGVGLQMAKSFEVDCETPVLVLVAYLTDEEGNILTNENGDWLAV